MAANIVKRGRGVKPVTKKEAADRTTLTAGLRLELCTHERNRVTRQHLELQKGAGGLEFSEALVPPGLEATVGMIDAHWGG